MLHPTIKKLLGFRATDSERKILGLWKARTSHLCKPCWELKYCPYGPIVEDFPLPPTTKSEANEHHQYLIAALKSGKMLDGTKLDKPSRKLFKLMIDDFDAKDHPDQIPPVVADASCRVFGHLCPVFFAAEPLTETKDRRRHSRRIPRDVMLKVVRRDGQICQECFQPVADDLVEFDHIIPFSKGGTSTSENIRLLCRDCNRKKSDSLKKILSPNPLQHISELTANKKK